MRHTAPIAAALLLCSTAGLAQDSTAYDGTTVGERFIQVSHYQFDHDSDGVDPANPESRDISGDGDGISIEFHMAIPSLGNLETAFANVRFVDAAYDNDNGGQETDYNEVRAGLGYYFIGRDRPARGLAYGGLNYEEQRFESGAVDVKDDGYSLGGGFRAFVTGGAELGAAIHWVDLGDLQGFRTAVSLAIELPLRIYLTAQWENQRLSRDFDQAANDSLDESYSRVRAGLRKDF